MTDLNGPVKAEHHTASAPRRAGRRSNRRSRRRPNLDRQPENRQIRSQRPCRGPGSIERQTTRHAAMSVTRRAPASSAMLVPARRLTQERRHPPSGPVGFDRPCGRFWHVFRRRHFLCLQKSVHANDPRAVATIHLKSPRLNRGSCCRSCCCRGPRPRLGESGGAVARPAPIPP